MRSVRRGPSRSIGTPSNGPSSAPGTESTTKSSARSPAPTSNLNDANPQIAMTAIQLPGFADRLPDEEQREAPDPQHAHRCTVTASAGARTRR